MLEHLFFWSHLKNMACPEIHVSLQDFFCCGPTTFFGVGFEINPELVDAPKHSMYMDVSKNRGTPKWMV